MNAKEFRESVENRLARLERAVYQEDVGELLEADPPSNPVERCIQDFMEECTVRARRNPHEHSKMRHDTLIRQDAWRTFVQWANEHEHDLVATLGRNTFYRVVVNMYHLPVITTYNKDAWAGRRLNLEGKHLLDRLPPTSESEEDE